MAAPADKPVLRTGIEGSEQETLRLEFNKLVTNLRTLCTKLDADVGVTDTNYFALIADSAASGPAKIT